MVSFVSLAKNQFHQQLSINIPVWSYSLRLIRGMIWVCHFEGITVYNRNLQHVEHIANEEIGWIHRIADVMYGVAVAASNGLYILTYNGNDFMIF